MPSTDTHAPNGKGTAPPIGHNGKLTPDEIEALGVHHQVKITEAQRKLDALLVDVAAARKAVNGAFKTMTRDLHFTRKRFQAEVLDKLNMSDAEYAAYTVETDMLHRIAGLKQGEQIDWIEHVAKDTVDEAEAAFQDGYRAGRRADEPKPPSHIAGILHPKWMEGYSAGQAYNVMQLGRASEILARPKAGEMAAADDGDKDETDPDAELEAEVKRLEETGWTAPTEEEAAVH